MAPPKPVLSTEPTTKRVHVGNLAPSVTAKDLVQRFSSFGTVQGGEAGVHGLGKTETGTSYVSAGALEGLEQLTPKRCRYFSLVRLLLARHDRRQIRKVYVRETSTLLRLPELTHWRIGVQACPC